MSHPDARFSGETALIERLLGRKPKVGYEVVARCPEGTPQVLRTDPLLWEDDRWKPFPTIFWLVCPRMKLQIARLETSGYIKIIGEELKSNENFFKAFADGQKIVNEFRLELARKISDFIPMDAWKVLCATNIAGSRSIYGVKCLHAHAAQELAFGKNPIGRFVLENIEACRSGISCVSPENDSPLAQVEPKEDPAKGGITHD